jgi:hypothetical protein
MPSIYNAKHILPILNHVFIIPNADGAVRVEHAFQEILRDLFSPVLEALSYTLHQDLSGIQQLQEILTTEHSITEEYLNSLLIDHLIILKKLLSINHICKRIRLKQNNKRIVYQ